MTSAHLFLISLEEEELLRFRTSSALGSEVLVGLYGYLPHSYLRVLRIWVIFLYLYFPYCIIVFCIFILFSLIVFVLFCKYPVVQFCLPFGYCHWSTVRCLCTLRYSFQLGIVSTARFLTVLRMMNTVGSYRSSHLLFTPWLMDIVACGLSQSSFCCPPPDRLT